MEELVIRVFAARDVAHREHLRTQSYSQHMALNAFYDEIIDQIDEIVESYQGQFGLLGDYQIETSPVANITAWIQSEMDWIASNRDQLANGSASIGNLIDSLVAIYQRTIYKLTNLQ
ncbi:DUF5856 family protein [Polynucleobacter sp. AP-Nino-20-G2]|uniref:DUF5856 family protein n=1 Tax=Polynucleobacter sp. AP-Nino-20-G2 TaxID=2576917 RepID=UPI001BFE0964|nr:DUF5856 family protein [Polynucleobacter sp. AP-Nino-20-G2]QWE17306.1 hypothetical protein FD960_03575 [Polynucleobacter sp. AP-Nino-20-G2]